MLLPELISMEDKKNTITYRTKKNDITIDKPNYKNYGNYILFDLYYRYSYKLDIFSSKLPLRPLQSSSLSHCLKFYFLFSILNFILHIKLQTILLGSNCI